MTRDPNSVRSFLGHADKVDILVPVWYTVAATGLVSGGPNPLVMETAREEHVPVMPIVNGSVFVQAQVRALLANSAAYHEMIADLIRACKENRYIGFQVDLENVNWTDRALFSTMITQAASEFHAQNLQVSVAAVPNAPGAAGETAFPRGFSGIGRAPTT